MLVREYFAFQGAGVQESHPLLIVSSVMVLLIRSSVILEKYFPAWQFHVLTFNAGTMKSPGTAMGRPAAAAWTAGSLGARNDTAGSVDGCSQVC